MSEQKMTTEQKQNREDVLDTIRRRAHEVINYLEGNGAWNIVIEDVQKQCKMLDDNWQFVDDDKKMREFRITKMAVMKVLNLIEDYRHDAKLANEELEILKNPEKNINKDTDEEP